MSRSDNKITEEQIANYVSNNLPNFEYVVGGYINNCTHYNLKCKNCGGLTETTWTKLTYYGCICEHCSTTDEIIKKYPHKRTIENSAPHLMQYFKEEDLHFTKKIAKGSKLKFDFVCPTCGAIKNTSVVSLSKRGFNCNMCGEYKSSPNRLISAFLNSFNIEYMQEKRFDWANRRVYDIYIPSVNLIIEMHGVQHYKENNLFKISLAEQIEIDKSKKQMATENGISNYIIIDASKNSYGFIMGNILNSGIVELLELDLENIDHNLLKLNCAQKSMLQEIVNEWNLFCENNEIFTFAEFVRSSKYSKKTIRDNIKTAYEMGMVNKQISDITNENQGYISELRKSKGIPVAQFTKDNKYIATFKTISEAERMTGVKSIKDCLKGKNKTAGGYIFRKLEIGGENL